MKDFKRKMKGEGSIKMIFRSSSNFSSYSL